MTHEKRMILKTTKKGRCDFMEPPKLKLKEGFLNPEVEGRTASHNKEAMKRFFFKLLEAHVGHFDIGLAGEVGDLGENLMLLMAAGDEIGDDGLCLRINLDGGLVSLRGNLRHNLVISPDRSIIGD